MKKSSTVLMAASVLALAGCSTNQNPPKLEYNTAASASDENLHSQVGEPLLDLLVGKWVLRGTIDGKETTHDFDAEWVLNREYVRIHEVSRDLGSNGAPSYEAIVFIRWNPKSSEYACLFLDSTGAADFPRMPIGRAKPSGQAIPFLFKLAGGHIFHSTLICKDATGTWQWVMDEEEGGRLQPFARVTLTKR
jgi:hypothetical protein